MAIINRRSLISTIDSFNDAIFRHLPWEDEAEPLIDWLTDRLGKGGDYAGSFALTDQDWDRDFRLFTGEKITTRVARAHIIAEEATRALAIVHRVTGLACPALRESEELLADRIFRHPGGTTALDGVYCCGKCSVALWRCIAAGGYSGHRDTIRQGLASLAQHRDGKGGWRRFPFYYTLSLLAEVNSNLALDVVKYCSPRFASLRRSLERRTDRFSRRRLQIINQLSRQPNLRGGAVA